MSANKYYQRFNVAQRLEHVLLVLVFTTLGITGLIQKYAESPVSIWVVTSLGGITVTRLIHRYAAITFILEAVYHFVVVGYKLFVLKLEASMLPGIKDALDALQVMAYNLGMRKGKPKMGRFNFAEKAEYWAMLWGLVLMGLTGVMMWNPILTTRLLPGQFIPAAKVAHGLEGVLAVLAIILWHFYNVHLKTWNASMIAGKLTSHQMADEHGLELEQIEKGEVHQKPSAEVIRRRAALYVPVAAVMAITLTAGFFWWINFKEKTITTVPPAENVVVYVVQTPTALPTAEPTPTPAPTTEGGAAASTWDGGIGELFAQKCKSCHGTMGGLSLGSYADAMKGSDKGAVITPGDAQGSVLVELLVKGGHPGSCTEDELQTIILWIDAGAMEK
jgi:formate dehydrogenase subunit gamma